jgi:CubicO group peptidase (beta-lactamase class C family)
VNQLDRLLRHATQHGTIPGAVLCVAHRGHTVWHQAYGAAELSPCRRPMHCQTLFDIASLTKVVATTSLVLLAHHEGVCRLDTPLHRFYAATADTPLGAVTLRQLLAHTGGLPAWLPLYAEHLPPGAPVMPPPRDTVRRQAVASILRTPLLSPPGTRMVYSDLGFILLSDILETLYAQSLDRLFLHRVAQPLGLYATAYRPLAAASPLPDAPAAYAATEACPWRQRVLRGEVHDENAWALGGIAGHAGLFATADDLRRFAQALLDTAAGRGSWLPQTLLLESWHRHPEPAGSTRALGWDTPIPGRSSAGALFSARAIGHLGFTGCSLWIDPVAQVIVVLCTNRVHPTRQATGITRLRPAVHDGVMRALGVATS